MSSILADSRCGFPWKGHTLSLIHISFLKRSVKGTDCPQIIIIFLLFSLVDASIHISGGASALLKDIFLTSGKEVLENVSFR